MYLSHPNPFAATAIALAAALSGIDASAWDCSAPATQAELGACAHEDFEAATAEQAAAMNALQAGLDTAGRQRWRAAQRAWMAWRTEQCRFESGPAAGGSAQGLVYWQCVARLTRERTQAIHRLSRCPEGDIACPVRRP